MRCCRALCHRGKRRGSTCGSWKRTRANAWSWASVFEVAAALGLSRVDLFRLPLCTWRHYVAGFEARIERERSLAAWCVSYLLIAAGADADKVQPDKLLGRGKPQRRMRELTDEEKFAKLWDRTENRRKAGKLKE